MGQLLGVRLHQCAVRTGLLFRNAFHPLIGLCRRLSLVGQALRLWMMTGVLLPVASSRRKWPCDANVLLQGGLHGLAASCQADSSLFGRIDLFWRFHTCEVF